MIDSTVATTSFLLHHHVPLLQSYFLDMLLQMEMQPSLPCYTSTASLEKQICFFAFWGFLSDNYCFIFLCI